jgi:hypothetical protein
MRAVVVQLFLFVLRLSYVFGQCHKLCSGHGACDMDGICTCYDGYAGGDCSLKECPSATSWVDYAVDNQKAHEMAECANRGTCDRSTGLCSCEPGYYGKHVERIIYITRQ